MAFLRPFLDRILEPLRAWNGREVYGVATRVHPAAPDGTVTADVACRRCGYNLRTLRVEAQCPECAMPVGPSVRGDELLYSDPRWIAKLEAGATVLIVVCVVLPASWVVVRLFAPAAIAINSGVLAGWLAGTWLLTTPDPSGAGEAWYGNLRKLARGLPWAVGITLVVDGLGRLMPVGVLPADVADTLMRMVGYLAVAAGFAAIVAMLGFVRSLAATRITDADLADGAGRVIFRCTAGVAGFALVALIGAARFEAAPEQGVIAGVMVVALLIRSVVALLSSALLVWSYVGLFLALLGLRGALSVQLQFSRHFWPLPSRAAGGV